jgi:hypothetical protein
MSTSTVKRPLIEDDEPTKKTPVHDDDPTPSRKQPLRDEPEPKTTKRPVQSKLDSILSHLRGVQRQSARQGMALCPAHADTNPSMSWAVKNQKFLFKCFAGCTQEKLCAKFAELGVTDFINVVDDITRFEIRDAAGTLVAVHVRQERPGAPKRMWWETPDGTRKLTTQTKRLPLYGVEQLTKVPPDHPVVLTEGEKKRDVLVARGFVAVATVTGASTIPDDDSLRPLVGRQVYLWPDNDEPGREHMQKIAARLRDMEGAA